jgi:group I intron endonuclease
MAVIYRITNMANGKYYIGSADSFARREWQHRYDLRRRKHKNPRLQAAWDKYGDEMFVFEVVEEVPDGQDQLVWEDKWLRECVGKPDCYNVNTLATAPRFGIPHSEETRQAISAKVQQAVSEGRGGAFIPSEATRAKMSASLKGNQNALGYKRTPEEIEAIRQRTRGNKNFLGKRHSEEAKGKMRRAMIGVTPEGKERAYAGMTVAAEELGVPYTMLVRLCKEGKVVAKGKLEGWFFAYQDEYKGRPEVAAPTIPDEYKDLPRTRHEAKAMGAKQYFTGLPCTHGHISPRLTKGTCIACRKEGLA